MFKKAEGEVDRRVKTAVRRELRKYADASETWFDGGIASVEGRLRSCDRLAHRIAAAIALIGVDDAYLTAAQNLKEDRKTLASLRDDLMGGAYHRSGFVHVGEVPASDVEAGEFQPGEESVSTGGQTLVGLRRSAERLTATLSPASKKWVVLETPKFLSRNSACYSMDELTARARNYAERVGVERLARMAFIRTVQAGCPPPPRRQKVASQFKDFDDVLMFVG